jgi:hypothetical protein
MGNYIFKYCITKLESDNEDTIPLVDYSHQINEIHNNCEDINTYITDEINPVINELKSRLYNLEVKNNFMNRELASIKYKIKENDDEFCSFADESEKSDIDLSENLSNSLIDID